MVHSATQIQVPSQRSSTPFFVLRAIAPVGPGPPHLRGFCITYNDVPQSIELLWTI